VYVDENKKKHVSGKCEQWESFKNKLKWKNKNLKERSD